MEKIDPWFFAEKNGDIIFDVIKKWSDYVPVRHYSVDQYTGGVSGATLDSEKGLYLFYLQDGSRSYPIYVGYTGRSFGIRFKEHATRESGVIKKCIDGKFMGGTTGYTLNVCTATFIPLTAMVIEYIFLNAFDFPLNRAENGDTRGNIDRNAPFPKADEARGGFREAYVSIMGGGGVEDIKKYFPDFPLK